MGRFRIYETEDSLNQYLGFHYETEADLRKNSAAAELIVRAGGFGFAARAAEVVRQMHSHKYREH